MNGHWFGLLIMLLGCAHNAHGAEPCYSLEEARGLGGGNWPRYKVIDKKRCWTMSDKRSRAAERVAAQEKPAERVSSRSPMATNIQQGEPRQIQPHPDVAPTTYIEEGFAAALPNDEARAIAVAILASGDSTAQYLIGEAPSPIKVRTVTIAEPSRFTWTAIALIIIAVASGFYTILALTIPKK